MKRFGIGFLELRTAQNSLHEKKPKKGVFYDSFTPFFVSGVLFACGWRDSNPRLLPCQGNTLNQLSYTHASRATNIIYAKEEEKRASEQKCFILFFLPAVLYHWHLHRERKNASVDRVDGVFWR